MKQINGYIGNFTTLLSADGTEKEYEHGVVIVAVGGKESAPQTNTCTARTAGC